jgi:predicted O-methyltransferase YrrM
VSDLEELEAENLRLRREVAGLRARVRAFESSRWVRLHPRTLSRALKARVTRGVHEPGDVQPVQPRTYPRLERFLDEVAARGTFTHKWFTGDVEAWEPVLEELQGKSARLLEIGSFEGFSACYLLWRLPDATITCIDTFAGGSEHLDTDIDTSSLEARFDANVALVGASRVRKLVNDSRRALFELASEDEPFDLIYVDGSHLGLDVLVDAALSWGLLAQGGVLIFDDHPWAVLGDDPFLRPGPAIDGFLSVVAERHEVIFADYQVAVRKLR